MNFLLVNDDGYDAPGIQALAQEFRKIGRVIIVAPLSEQSATGHRVTIRELVFVEKIKEDVYAVDSSPADCVRLGLFAPHEDFPTFDYVISGINKGGNLGTDIYYSGTLAGAREATFLGVPSVGFSMWVDHSKPTPSFKKAAEESVKLFLKLQSNNLFKEDLYYNINFPTFDPYKGVKITKTGKFVYDVKVTKVNTIDQEKQGFFIDGFLTLTDSYVGGNDFTSIQNNFISINPLWIGDQDSVLTQELKSIFEH